MAYEFIDLASPDLGKQLIKNATGDLPIDVWRLYVLHHDPNPPRAGTRHLWSPPSVIHYCDEPVRATLDPQKAVDDAYRILAITLFTSPQGSYTPLAKGIWDAYTVLGRAHSSRRQRGQPTSMRNEAVRAFVIRRFNRHPTTGKPTVGFTRLADLFFLENGRCPRKIKDDVGERQICGLTTHRHDSPCVKALQTAVGHLVSAMKHDGIPTEEQATEI